MPPSSSGNYDAGPDPAELERERLRLEQERLKKERIDRAATADRNGLAAASRGDWDSALNYFLDAASGDPSNAIYRSHVTKAQAEIASRKSAAQMAAVRLRIEDTLVAIEAEAARQRLEDELAASAASGFIDSFYREVTSNRIYGKSAGFVSLDKYKGPFRIYPYAQRSIPNASPIGRVLQSNQARIAAIDNELEETLRTLRNLIKLNSDSERDRLEWTKSSEDAALAAEDLSINLVLDLADELLKDQVSMNRSQRSALLDTIFSRKNSKEVGVHTIYGMLINQSQELDKRRDLVGLSKQLMELQTQISEFSMSDRERPSDFFFRKNTGVHAEDWFTTLTRFEKVDEIAGPYKNLIDAAYVIWKQAASLEVLLVTQQNQQRIYDASKLLQQRVRSLVAEKKRLSTSKSTTSR